MNRLSLSIRELDDATAKGFRLMLPEEIATMLDAIRSGTNNAAVGEALAGLTKAVSLIPDQQFEALAPIGPKNVVAVLAELRTLFKEEEKKP
jgi:hypothetical protein